MMIRVMLPPLTEERRKELVKAIKKHAEEGKVAIRNIRRDAVDEAKAAKEKKTITEDQEKNLETEIQKLTDTEVQGIDKLVAAKDKEVMEV